MEKGAAQVIVAHITVQPRGHTPWHYHPGPHIVTVKTGTVEVYETRLHLEDLPGRHRLLRPRRHPAAPHPHPHPPQPVDRPGRRDRHHRHPHRRPPPDGRRRPPARSLLHVADGRVAAGGVAPLPADVDRRGGQCCTRPGRRPRTINLAVNLLAVCSRVRGLLNDGPLLGWDPGTDAGGRAPISRRAVLKRADAAERAVAPRERTSGLLDQGDGRMPERRSSLHRRVFCTDFHGTPVLTGSKPAMAHVTLFDGPNFTGSSLVLGRGGHRLGVGEARLVAFNDRARSLRVEQGFVAVVYQHPEASGA